MSRLALAILLPVATACGTPATPPAAPHPSPGSAAPTAAAPAPAPTPPTLRLPRDFLPTAYAVQLRVAPDADAFAGHVDITGARAVAGDVIWLHAEHLQITTATATTSAGTVALEVLAAEPFVALRAPGALAAGPVSLAIDYTGVVAKDDMLGVFRQKDGDTWYAFTQFEPTAARRAFPCFDEPDVKVPWQLALDVPTGAIAVTNTPVTSDVPATDGATHRMTFAPTRPLPSYLVAFAVGPFETVAAGATGAGVPIRVVVPKGRTTEASWAVEATGPIVERLEDYFGTPYPYDKLDLLAIPEFPGAMENPGLVTFARDLLLAPAGEATIAHRRAYATVGAHELAHQWFGDLVTTAWWDDIWLNEAFATWMEGKIVEEWKPEWGGGVDAVAERNAAMGSDSLKTARRIRQPIESEGDIRTAFDGITYGKGASVIRMFEAWVGADKFRDGIRAYLAAHAWGNATSRDFLTAIGAAAGADVATPFSTFLDQVGAPLVTATLACPRGGRPTVTLTQSRYVPVGSDADPNQTWQIPVCTTYATKRGTARACTVLTAPTGTLELADATGCPAWVLPNSGEIGYYRTALDKDLHARLLANLGKLSLPERVGFIGDVEALVGAGKVPAGDAFALVGKLAKDGDRHIVAASVGIAASADELIDDALRPNYRRFIRKMFGARARALGFVGKPDDSEDRKLLRATVVGLVADEGEDPVLVKAARDLATAWLGDRSAVPADMVDLVLRVATAHGDAALYDQFLALAKAATDGHERERYLGALGGFRDPALVKRSIELAIGPDFSIFEAGALMMGGMASPTTRHMIYDEVKANYDAIAGKLPEAYRPYLVGVGVALCDAAAREDVAAFFTPRVGSIAGGDRILAQMLEQMDLCIAGRAAQRPGIEAFLRKY